MSTNITDGEAVYIVHKNVFIYGIWKLDENMTVEVSFRILRQKNKINTATRQQATIFQVKTILTGARLIITEDV